MTDELREHMHGRLGAQSLAGTKLRSPSAMIVRGATTLDLARPFATAHTQARLLAHTAVRCGKQHECWTQYMGRIKGLGYVSFGSAPPGS